MPTIWIFCCMPAGSTPSCEIMLTPRTCSNSISASRKRPGPTRSDAPQSTTPCRWRSRPIRSPKASPTGYPNTGLHRVKPPDPEPEGTPNWFSAYRNPPGIAYCPISLMPNARVVDVKASRKLTTTFQWTGDQLTSVQNTSLEPGEGKSAVYFDYFKDRGGVRRVSVEPLEDAAADLPTPRFTAAGTVGTGKGTYLGLPN